MVNQAFVEESGLDKIDGLAKRCPAEILELESLLFYPLALWP